MRYRVESVRLCRFRNYADTTIEMDQGTTVLLGPNGAGKTNVIEAVQLLLTGESFRRANGADLVMWGATEGEAATTLRGSGVEARLTLRVEATGARSLHVNGERKRRVSAGRDLLPCVVFTPDDLRIVKGPAEDRRAALDAVGDRLSKTFAALRLDYERLVRQRNKALKEGAPDTLLDVLADRLSEVGGRLVAHRVGLLRRMEEAAGLAYAAVSAGQGLKARYVAHWSGDAALDAPESASEAIRAAIEKGAAEERARGMTLAGPHRDDVAFLIDGRDARAFGSQGQQRSVALAWKLAEVDVAEVVLGKAPVLLLDDVMSELDESRRHALARFVSERVQTIVTTANLEYLEPTVLERATVRRIG